MPENDLKVLDKGFVHLVEHMGGDRAVVQAARVCYKSDGLGDPDKDRKLIHYLLAHQHGTPFEHAVLKFHVKAPIFVARQWFRHRMSSYNETSGRYAEVKDEFYIPKRWRAQDTKNRQGSLPINWAGDVGESQQLLWGRRLEMCCAEAMAEYRSLLNEGIAKEMARMLLPVNLYTEFYWTVNARALMHFIGLRSEQHAQWEIRQYSNALWRLWAPVMPWTAAAFLQSIDLGRYNGGPDGLPGPNANDIPKEKETLL